MLVKKSIVLLLFCFLSLTAFSTPAARQKENPQAKQAFDILQASCANCHDDQGDDKDKFWLNYPAMLKEGTVVPGKPDASLLYTIVKSEKMPRDGAKLTAAQLNVIREWILAGAPTWNSKE